jgi:hypothetical protein
MLLAATGVLTYELVLHYGELALLAKPEAGMPAGATVVGLATGSWTLIVAGIFLLLLLFPSGNLPSRRWRYPARAVPAVLALVLLLTIVIDAKLEAPFQEFENPLALTDNEAYLNLTLPLIVACLLATCAAGIHLIYRFWRSQGDEREQFKWLALAAGLLVVTFPLQGLNEAVDVLGGIAFLALPIAVGIAVLRHRLYDIDLIINRTLVYVPLTALLAGLFVASTGITRTLFTDLTDAGSDAAIAMSTLLVVAALTPVKNQLQAFVDRHFKEQKVPAQEVRKLASQARSVLQILDTDEFVRNFLENITTSIKAEGSAIELSDGAAPGLIAFGRWNGYASLSLPLRHGEQELGRLGIGQRSSGRAYDEAEQEALAESAAVLAHALILVHKTRARVAPSAV